jgi:hypothetical protein
MAMCMTIHLGIKSDNAILQRYCIKDKMQFNEIIESSKIKGIVNDH